MLIVKVERDDFHYCLDCAGRFIATAREELDALQADLLGPRA